MAAQYSLNNLYENPELDYQAQELSKKLKYSMANFAQVRFKRAIQMHVSIVDNKKLA